VTFKIPRRSSNGGWVLLVILVILFLFFAFLSLYFFIIGKRIQNRLESEIRDVPNSGGVTTYHAVSK
jgi:membrane protein implicated in regulation of membrane protease activity